MKSNILILTLSLFFINSFTVFSQDLTVSDQMIKNDDEMQASIKVILKPDSKTVKKAYRDWMEENYNVDVDGIGFLKNKDVLKIKEEEIKGISNNKMDLYARIVEKGDYTEMDIFGSFGYDLHLDPESSPEEYRRTKSIIYAFLNDFLPGYYEEIVEETADQIEDLKENESDARDKMADNREEIEKLRKENEELANKIKEYESKLEKTEIQLVNQKKQKVEIKKAIIQNEK